MSEIDYGLKPCPFCGTDVNQCVSEFEFDQAGLRRIVIECCGRFEFETGIIRSVTGETIVIEDLIEKWNRRTTDHDNK